MPNSSPALSAFVATLVKEPNGIMQFVGPLNFKYVGNSTSYGPEDKTGELGLRRLRPSASVERTLLIDGSECSFTALKGHGGLMICRTVTRFPARVWAPRAGS
jgi:hypothetical protein